jgi:hypothetical protein
MGLLEQPDPRAPRALQAHKARRDRLVSREPLVRAVTQAPRARKALLGLTESPELPAQPARKVQRVLRDRPALREPPAHVVIQGQ